MKEPRYTKPVDIKQSTGDLRRIYSPRLQRIVTLYSALEYDHFVAVEQDSTIETFCEQPIRISVVIDGKPVSPLFDMWLRKKDGYEEYREIKPSDKLDEPGNIRQIQAETAWCKTQGIPFRVITEQDIGLDMQALENWKQILPYLSNTAWVTHKGLDTTIEKYLRDKKSATLGELEQLFSAPPSELHRAAFLLLHRGTAAANLSTAQLTRRTLIEWRDDNG